MKITQLSAKSSLGKLFGKHRSSPPKPRSAPRPAPQSVPHPAPHAPAKNRTARIVGAVLLSGLIGALITNHYFPALPTNAGEFIWSIKSSFAELVLALVAARVPRHH